MDNMSTNQNEDVEPNWVRIAGQASFIPVYLALYPIAFFMIGRWLDNYFGLTWIKIPFLFLGMFSGFRQTYFVIRRLISQLEKMNDS
ncbi:AtpZ/AtpI family protein, partial [bacterium]|nr:AtpZ/AtpI family protein [bacterium]